MAILIEKFMSDKKVESFTPIEVLANEITHLICRMSDTYKLVENKELKNIIEDWRQTLVRIRHAIEVNNV